MSEKNVVQRALTDISVERVNVAWHKAKQNELYIEADKRQTIAFQLLSESLTTDRQKQLLYDLESAWNFVEGLMQEFAYRQGLQDSQMIHRELSDFGISVTKESLNYE